MIALHPGRFLKYAALAVLADRMPGETPAVHGHIYARFQGLHKCQSGAQVEQAVRTAEGVGDHGAGQNDGLAGNAFAEDGGGLLHGVGAVGDDNTAGGVAGAAVEQQLPVRIGHLQAVDHHEGFDIHLEMAPAQPEHIGDVGAIEVEYRGDLVVLLVEGAAGDEDLDAIGGHAKGEYSAWWGNTAL